MIHNYDLGCTCVSIIHESGLRETLLCMKHREEEVQLMIAKRDGWLKLYRVEKPEPTLKDKLNQVIHLLQEIKDKL